MPSIQRTITTTTSPNLVFPYLADFENAPEWDAGTVTCLRIQGDGDIGSVYRNTSKFMGNTVQLDYTLEVATSPTIRLVGRNKSTQSTDTMTVTPSGTGAQVEYRAEFVFLGIFKVLAPLLTPFLKKLGDDAEKSLKKALDGLS